MISRARPTSTGKGSRQRQAARRFDMQKAKPQRYIGDFFASLRQTIPLNLEDLLLAIRFQEK